VNTSANASADSFVIEPAHRGVIKQALILIGYPAEDLAGYTEGASLPMALRQITRVGLPFKIRDYQRGSADTFYAGGDVRGGSGVVVLPCGAGKTVVGIVAMTMMQKNTLVLTTSISAVKQWIREILDKTDLKDSDVAEYSGEMKTIGPVTVATYQIVTHRSSKDDEFPHFKIFDERDWGLIIYDEVHLLPAPVFRVTAQIQARRRLGLTATLIREDGREGDVFSLIGPKKYDVPWRELEQKGWIAEANCTEIRVALPEPLRMEYAVAEWRNKYRIASENPAKEDIVAKLLEQYADKNVIVIGQYLKQLRSMRDRFDLPLITGATPTSEREELYGKFRRGEIKQLLLSKVGNFAIDLPDAHVLIQVSGTFGSRQEEAQRLGRVLRPKASGEGAALLHAGDPRHARTRLLAPSSDVSHRARLQLRNRGRRRPPRDTEDRMTPNIEKARIPVKLHRRVCLVQTEDAVLAEEVLANRKIAVDIVGRLADRVLLVRPGRVDAVVQELQRMGHTPQVASGG